jgi:hypothetical protein
MNQEEKCHRKKKIDLLDNNDPCGSNLIIFNQRTGV